MGFAGVCVYIYRPPRSLYGVCMRQVLYVNVACCKIAVRCEPCSLPIETNPTERVLDTGQGSLQITRSRSRSKISRRLARSLHKHQARPRRRRTKAPTLLHLREYHTANNTSNQLTHLDHSTRPSSRSRSDQRNVSSPRTKMSSASLLPSLKHVETSSSRRPTSESSLPMKSQKSFPPY